MQGSNQNQIVEEAKQNTQVPQSEPAAAVLANQPGVAEGDAQRMLTDQVVANNSGELADDF